MTVIARASEKSDRATVWIVEDSPLEAEIAKRTLSTTYDVVVFVDASSLLEQLASSRLPSAIILDWQMPGLSGLDACKFVRTTCNQNELPIIMLTGLAERADLVEAISAGANDYLTKPYDRAELCARVATAVRTKQLHDRLVEAEARERDACADAQAANLAKDEFLALASHELRTPLNAILGWVRLLQTGTLDDSRHARALDTIERNAKAQVQLIEDILDGSRMITGKLHLAIAPIDLGSVVKAALLSMKPAMDAKAIVLSLNVGAEAAQMNGDAERLQQIVWNLVSNAIKFTPKNGHIDATVESIGDSVRLTVRDDGQGVAADFLPHMFERFQQGDGKSTPRQGGLGLGLALVRNLVEAHGGRVDASSAGQGFGTTVTVVFPASVAPSLSEPLLQANVAVLGAFQAASPLRGMRVLIVDDQEDGREILATALLVSGADVTAAASAEEALRVVGQVLPHVIVSDVGMPIVDGFELMKRLRALGVAEGGRVPALALTAYSQDSDRERALEAGFDSYLSKPVNPSDLVAAVLALSAHIHSERPFEPRVPR